MAAPQNQEAAMESGQPAAPQPAGCAARRVAVVVDNIANGGKRVVLTHAAALITTTIGTLLSFLAYKGTEEGCLSEPVALKEWFMIMGVWQLMSFGLFFMLLISSLTVFSAQLDQARARALRQQQFSSTESPDHQPDEEKACCTHCSLMILTSFCMVLTTFLVLWALLGLLSAIDASAEAKSTPCNRGRSYFWYLFALSVFNLCCCNCGSMADMHKDRTAKPSAAAPVAEVSM